VKSSYQRTTVLDRRLLSGRTCRQPSFLSAGFADVAGAITAASATHRDAAAGLSPAARRQVIVE
jgi:hypothetical protein